jgi:hypothetical protein
VNEDGFDDSKMIMIVIVDIGYNIDFGVDFGVRRKWRDARKIRRDERKRDGNMVMVRSTHHGY